MLNNGRGYVGTFPSLFLPADESAPLPAWRWDRHEFLDFRSLPLAHVPQPMPNANIRTPISHAPLAHMPHPMHISLGWAG